MILQEITRIFFNGLGDFEGLRGLDKKLEGRGWSVEETGNGKATAKALAQRSQRERSFAEENRQRQRQQL
jgi:hypothetical protein